MSYRLTDGYLRPSADGYVRLFKDGYSAFLTHDGYNIGLFSTSGTVFDSAKGIVYLANRTTAPDGYQPSGGGWFYAENGDGYWKAPTGLVQSISATRISRAFPSDANYTAVQTDYQSKIMEFTGTIGADRDIALPNISGYQWTVFNGTTGGFNVVFKVTGQTGVTVGNGKRCIVYCNGTDIVRVTPDT
jgi:hypothetical protein